MSWSWSSARTRRIGIRIGIDDGYASREPDRVTEDEPGRVTAEAGERFADLFRAYLTFHRRDRPRGPLAGPPATRPPPARTWNARPPGVSAVRACRAGHYAANSVQILVHQRYDRLVVGDGGAELGGQANAPAPLRIGQQVTDLGDGKRRYHQARPVVGEEPRAPGMIAVSLIEGSDKRPRIAQDHADAAPLALPGRGRTGTCHD